MDWEFGYGEQLSLSPPPPTTASPGTNGSGGGGGCRLFLCAGGDGGCRLSLCAGGGAGGKSEFLWEILDFGLGFLLESLILLLNLLSFLSVGSETWQVDDNFSQSESREFVLAVVIIYCSLPELKWKIVVVGCGDESYWKSSWWETN